MASHTPRPLHHPQSHTYPRYLLPPLTHPDRAYRCSSQTRRRPGGRSAVGEGRGNTLPEEALLVRVDPLQGDQASHRCLLAKGRLSKFSAYFSSSSSSIQIDFILCSDIEDMILVNWTSIA